MGVRVGLEEAAECERTHLAVERLAAACALGRLLDVRVVCEHVGQRGVARAPHRAAAAVGPVALRVVQQRLRGHDTLPLAVCHARDARRGEDRVVQVGAQTRGHHVAARQVAL